MLNGIVLYLAVCKQKLYLCETELFEIELFTCIKTDQALNNLQWLMCHKTNQTKPKWKNKGFFFFFFLLEMNNPKFLTNKKIYLFLCINNVIKSA